jgi:hypothetical protein
MMWGSEVLYVLWWFIYQCGRFLGSLNMEKITKNHHITGNGFKKPPLFGKFSKNHQSTGNT